MYLPDRSGSLSTVCPSVPSGVCTLSKNGGCVSVAYFYAKHILPRRGCARENGGREQKQGESGTARWRGRILCFSILQSYDRACWQENISGTLAGCLLSVLAAAIDLGTRGVLWVKDTSWSRPEACARQPACITESTNRSMSSTSKTQTDFSWGECLFPLSHGDLWPGWQHLFLPSVSMCTSIWVNMNS